MTAAESLKKLTDMWVGYIDQGASHDTASLLLGERFLLEAESILMELDLDERRMQSLLQTYGAAVEEVAVYRTRLQSALLLHRPVGYGDQIICAGCSGFRTHPTPSVDLGICPYPCATTQTLKESL